MSQRHPWAPFYWDDWATATAHLSHAEYSIYHRLLTHYYRTHKPLVANATLLPRLCYALGTAEAEALQSVLEQFFELRPDGYHNKRADLEIEKFVSISNKRAEVGKKGGLAKARNLLQQNPTQPQPHIHTESNPPISPPPTRGSNGNLTVRDRRRLNDEIWRLMEKNCAMPLEEALQTACAELLLPIKAARAAVDQAGMGDGLSHKGKKK